MDFREFANEIKEGIPDYMLKYNVKNVRLDNVIKNNGVELLGLVICLEDEKVSPNIYLNYYYELYRQGKSIIEILELIRDEYEESYKSLHSGMLGNFDKDNIRDRIFLRLVNCAKNEMILDEIPYIHFHDLIITFRYLVKQDDAGIASAILRNGELAELNISMDELFEIAKKNTERLFPMELMLMSAMIPFEENEVPRFPRMYVLTNSRRINGATYMVYDEVLEKFADSINESFYIIPSSIHELLLLPASDMHNIDNMKQTVQDVNECAVSEIDYLSDNVYYYDRKSKIINICV